MQPATSKQAPHVANSQLIEPNDVEEPATEVDKEDDEEENDDGDEEEEEELERVVVVPMVPIGVDVVGLIVIVPDVDAAGGDGVGDAVADGRVVVVVVVGLVVSDIGRSL